MARSAIRRGRIHLGQKRPNARISRAIVRWRGRRPAALDNAKTEYPWPLRPRHKTVPQSPTNPQKEAQKCAASAGGIWYDVVRIEPFALASGPVLRLSRESWCGLLRRSTRRRGSRAWMTEKSAGSGSLFETIALPAQCREGSAAARKKPRTGATHDDRPLSASRERTSPRIHVD